jgi:hypothetical protein
MAAVKQLMLRRADARQILDSLAEDDNREQR